MAEGNSTCHFSSIIPWETGNQYLANDLALSSVNGFSAVLALICNLAIAVVMKTKQLIKIPCHVLIFSLTLVDSVAALIARPLYIALRLVLHYNYLTCYSLERLAKMAESAIMFCAGCSFMHMVCIARDRYNALCNPIQYQLPRKKKVAGYEACVCWATWGIIVVLLQWIITGRAQTAVRAAIATVLVTSLIAYHAKIFVAVSRYNHSVINDERSLHVQRLIIREKKVLADMRYTLMAFMLLFIPTAVLSVLRPAGVYANAVFPWSMTITLLNSSVNPLIHVWRNRTLRRFVFPMQIFFNKFLKRGRI